MDSAFHSNADPDPGFENSADPNKSVSGSVEKTDYLCIGEDFKYCTSTIGTIREIYNFY
jgi:hypothetical protein